MHICFITNEYPKAGFPHGGIGTFVSTIGKALVKVGHKVTVLGINIYNELDEIEVEDNIIIYRLKPKKVKGFTWWYNNMIINNKLNEIHKENVIDIIETSELGLAFIKKNKTTKYIIRLHGGHHFFSEAEQRKVSFWKGFQEKRSFKKADGFIAVSRYVKQHTEKYLSYHNKPIDIIMSPINLDIFKANVNAKEKKSIILFAGTICRKKGIDQLIKAMPKVIQKFPEAQLHIYGRDWYFKDGSSYVTYLKEEVIPSLDSVASNIHFKGIVRMNDLATKYSEAKVCVFPSLMETQGLVVPEAMAMNTLVIFSTYGPGPEIIEHNKTGLLCDPYISDDIADKIIWALSNPKTSQQIANNGRVFVLKNFDINNKVTKNLNFYNSLQ